jgi:glycosyltransferase involved in cell wall biosynthesis
MRFAQFLPSIAPHDAVSEHTLALSRLLAAQTGEPCPVYAENIHQKLAGRVRNFRLYDGDADVLVYQHSIGTAVADFVGERPEPLVVNYHNITPAEFFEPYEPHFAAYLNTGRRQLAELAGRTTLAVTPSRYNAVELDDLGYRHVEVAPILLEPSSMDVEPSARVRRRLARRGDAAGADFLFVGRLSPNKAQHDLICAFAAFRRSFDPHARLHLIGGKSSHGYVRALRTLVAELGLGDAVSMPDQVSQSELVAYFREADLFVSASVHEGFCVPLVEAMRSGLPVVARGAAAIPETLGDAGVVYPDDPSPSYAQVAGLWWLVLQDTALRTSLVDAGHRRAAEFFSPAVADRYRVLLASVADDVAGTAAAGNVPGGPLAGGVRR